MNNLLKKLFYILFFEEQERWYRGGGACGITKRWSSGVNKGKWE